ncbi:Golgi-associated plant pathogenesis-related protein 1-like [Patiria miniata]|uniref:SCP domain-containing protein n=1 Tax=Patiria miniata TaxID=46514 RepID=A0A913Z2Q2_PATMI|nr:Golgi-associated plant pathogenesis-related protein 1-like [Patiria miniata]
MPEDSLIEEFKESCLDAHNRLRKDYGAPPLKWADDVATQASNWAQNLAEKGYKQHSENQLLGENIHITTLDEDISGEGLVDLWEKETEYYDFDNPRWQKGTERFTQMVWKSTTEIGIAKAKMLNAERYVVVINYRPPGNTNRPNDFKKNVLPKQ